jgi:NADH-quinone oxidoreductase subunit M
LDIFSGHALSVILFLPVVGALIIAFLPEGSRKMAGPVALAVSLVDLILAVSLLPGFDPAGGFQLVEKASWIPRFGISYYLGVDGLSLSMVVLTAFLTPLSVLCSFRGITKHERGFYASLLLLETGMLGVFVALDLVLFYLFWEAMLLPMYFIIGIWGGKNRIYAAVKFILYTVAGSLLMLVAILVLFNYNIAMGGEKTFNLLTLIDLSLPSGLQMWLFLAFFISFAIKVPVFPFHTWLPDAHVEAPTAGSVILAGILLKMGTYGFFRFCIPLFPEASVRFAPVAILLAFIGIIYGAMLALAQDDLKRLVAYSSISHLGFVVLGTFIFNQHGAVGALYQMISHGLTTGALFMLVGMVYERTHTRMIPSMSGLKNRLPLLAGVVTIFSLASMGLPGMSSFIGEFLILSGSFQARLSFLFLAIIGIVLGAVYMLWMVRRVVFGVWPEALKSEYGDLSLREIICLVPLLAAVIWLGIFPQPLIRLVKPSLEAIMKNVGGM